jgi:hypothetical protein
MDSEGQPSNPRRPAPRPLAWTTDRPGWVRCQVMGRPAQLWTRPDTDTPAEATSRPEDSSMLKKAKSRAATIWSTSTGLYREMALSALRLVRR